MIEFPSIDILSDFDVTFRDNTRIMRKDGEISITFPNTQYPIIIDIDGHISRPGYDIGDLVSESNWYNVSITRIYTNCQLEEYIGHRKHESVIYADGIYTNDDTIKQIEYRRANLNCIRYITIRDGKIEIQTEDTQLRKKITYFYDSPEPKIEEYRKMHRFRHR